MQAALERRRKRLERMQQRGKERIQGEATGSHGGLPGPSPGYEPDAGPWMPHGPDAGAAASLWPPSAAGGAADGIIRACFPPCGLSRCATVAYTQSLYSLQPGSARIPPFPRRNSRLRVFADERSTRSVAVGTFSRLIRPDGVSSGCWE